MLNARVSITQFSTWMVLNSPKTTRLRDLSSISTIPSENPKNKQTRDLNGFTYSFYTVCFEFSRALAENIKIHNLSCDRVSLRKKVLLIPLSCQYHNNGQRFFWRKTTICHGKIFINLFFLTGVSP